MSEEQSFEDKLNAHRAKQARLREIEAEASAIFFASYPAGFMVEATEVIVTREQYDRLIELMKERCALFGLTIHDSSGLSYYGVPVVCK